MMILVRINQNAMPCCRLLILLGLSLICGAAPTSVAQTTSRSLNAGWEFRAVNPDASHPGIDQWHTATVPGVVQTDLLKSGLIPDPFYGANEKQLQWIGTTDWEYRQTLTADATLLSQQHIELVFEGLDTFADVTLNGQPVLSGNNQFREWRADIKALLKPGSNTLHLLIHSPVNTVTPLVAAQPYILPGSGYEPLDRAKNIYPVGHYMRKAPYNFGWDWGPVFITSGIWRPVRLDTWNDVRIARLNVQQPSVTQARAVLSVEVDVDADASTKADMHLTYTGPDHQAHEVAEPAVSLDAGHNHISLPLRVESAHLWYPNGYGAQDRYTFAVSLSRAGKPLVRTEVKSGLRSVELRRQADQWGKSFEFVINGIPVFIKGANVVPFDSFSPSVTPERHRHMLQSAKDANMNLVRMWGGGYYETDDFYDLADELGIMVWQEFAFGGAMVPGDLAFQQNVRQEAVEQVQRLRNHPSVVLWCGNNEVETAWSAWDDRQTFKKSITPDQRERVWQDYVVMFRDILKGVVLEHGNGVPYWPSSPGADFEDLAGNDHNGDMHSWDVWSGGKPIETYATLKSRFVSEYGFQSMPDLQTVKAFAGNEESLTSPLLLNHERFIHGFDRMNQYLAVEYRTPKDFASFVYLSQLMQASAIKIAAEHLRSEMPRTMGSIYWQLNDCWPVASWASIDYFGRWKALQFYARRFYAPVLIAPNYTDGKITVKVISDLQQPIRGEARVTVMDFTGKVLNTQTRPVNATPLASTEVMQLPLSIPDPKTTVAVVELLEKGKPIASNMLFFAKPREEVLPPAHLTGTIEQQGTHYLVDVTTNAFARDVALSFGTADPDAQLSDNYINLLPNKHVQITVDSKASLAALRSALQLRSLADATNP